MIRVTIRWKDAVIAGHGEDHRDAAVIDSEGVRTIMVVVVTTVLLMRVVVRVRTMAVVMIVMLMM